MLGRKLHGLRFPKFSEVDNDYCDDVEILIEDDQDLLKAEEMFTKFESFAGDILNRSSKSKVQGIGRHQESRSFRLAFAMINGRE